MDESFIIALGVTNLLLLGILAMLKIIINNLRVERIKFGEEVKKLTECIDANSTGIKSGIKAMVDSSKKQHQSIMYISQDLEILRERLSIKK